MKKITEESKAKFWKEYTAAEGNKLKRQWICWVYEFQYQSPKHVIGQVLGAIRLIIAYSPKLLYTYGRPIVIRFIWNPLAKFVIQPVVYAYIYTIYIPMRRFQDYITDLFTPY